MRIGVFPIDDHYYEPQFDMRNCKRPFSEKRPLEGIFWNLQDQLGLLKHLTFADEITDIPQTRSDKIEFHFNNGAFETGDAEYWYQFLRFKKPGRLFEIGSGSSTLLAQKAIRENRRTNPEYDCQHVCIEPYERPWLEKIGVTVVREKVEDLEISFFSELDAGDILFIDSSHIIRPEGDILFEYLTLLPCLKKGVIVHVHDIFSPRNYLADWLVEDVRFWNEQYLLEAFLTNNSEWKIIGALNLIHHDHFDELLKVCPFLTREREPGSFYMEKIG